MAKDDERAAGLERGGWKDSMLGGKPRLSLIAPEALLALGRVLTYGAAKYRPHNWRGGMPWSEIADALLRHVTAFLGGEDRDPESGELHMAHALCNAMFLVAYQVRGAGTDDRWRPPVPDAAPGRTDDKP